MLRVAFALALLAGCSGPAAVTADTLVGTTWSEVCPGSDPEVSYLRLDADGSFAWSYESLTEAATDTGDRWTVSGTTLTISWNDGFATTTYDLTVIGSGTLPGASSKDCGSLARLVRE